MYSPLRQGNLVRKVPPSANHRFNFAAPQSHIGQGAIVEPQDQADLAAPTLLIHQFACQLDGAMGEHGEPFRELTSGAAQQRIHDKVAIALRLAMQLIGRRQRWVPEDLPVRGFCVASHSFNSGLDVRSRQRDRTPHDWAVDRRGKSVGVTARHGLVV